MNEVGAGFRVNPVHTERLRRESRRPTTNACVRGGDVLATRRFGNRELDFRSEIQLARELDEFANAEPGYAAIDQSRNAMWATAGQAPC